MTDIEHTHPSPALSPVAGLRAAADSLACARFLPSELDLAHEFAAVAMAELSPDLVDQVERALRRGDHRRLDELANALEPPQAPAPEPKPRRPRKPSIKKIIAAAERDGRNVTSVTMPDGVTLHFGKVEDTEASNPWLDDLKVTKQ